MKKRFAVIGLGLFGWRVAESLSQMGAEVIAVDKNFELIERIKDQVMVAVQLDATNPKALLAQDIATVDAAVVGIGKEFEECLLTVVQLKQLGVRKVVSRAATHLQKDILEQVGCDQVILPEEEVGYRVANHLISGIIQEQMELGDQHSIVQLVTPPDFVGKSIVELQLRERYQINIITIKRQVTERNLWGKLVVREKVCDVPRPQDTLEEGDILVLFGHDDDLRRLMGGVTQET
ncbi:MAG: TrkA family potassium uptake protein [Gemmatimonadetes bacterium]|nr:MAG: TrkA family potassium uptake protein [Gemmatimonadota bacterium]